MLTRKTVDFDGTRHKNAQTIPVLIHSKNVTRHSVVHAERVCIYALIIEQNNSYYFTHHHIRKQYHYSSKRGKQILKLR